MDKEGLNGVNSKYMERDMTPYQLASDTSDEIRRAFADPGLEVLSVVVRGGRYIPYSTAEAGVQGVYTACYRCATGATFPISYFLYPDREVSVVNSGPDEPQPSVPLRVGLQRLVEGHVTMEPLQDELLPVLRYVKIREKPQFLL